MCFPPYLSSQWGIVPSKYIWIHSIFCKISFAQSELDNQPSRLSVVFADPLSSFLCVRPSSDTWLESTCARSWVQCNHSKASFELAGAAPPGQANHSSTHVVQPPWALSEFLSAFCIPRWI